MTEQTAPAVREPPFDNLSSRWALIAFLISSPALLAFYWIGRKGEGLAAYFSIAIFVLLVKVCWPLRSRWWVWLILTAFALSHLGLVALLPPFDLQSPAVALVPAGIVDFLLWFTILWQAQKRLD